MQAYFVLVAPFAQVAVDLQARDLTFLRSPDRACTMATCFDLARCPPLTPKTPAAPPALVPIYIYPEDAGIEGWLWSLRRIGGYATALERGRMHFVARVVDALRHDPAALGARIVDDPDEACLFVPRVSCLEVNKCDVWEGLAPWRLRALPHWRGGRNHVVFDISDDSGSKFDSGKALRVRSSFGRRFYRPRFDVAMPLHPRWFLSADAHKWPPRARPLLASFRGSDTDPVGLRRALARLDNGPGGDVVVRLRSMGDKVADKRYFRYRKGWRRDAESYGSLLLRARFALVPRGFGLHSHRLLEALSAGAVPVVIADGLVLPFEQEDDGGGGGGAGGGRSGGRGTHDGTRGDGGDGDGSSGESESGAYSGSAGVPWGEIAIRVPQGILDDGDGGGGGGGGGGDGLLFGGGAEETSNTTASADTDTQKEPALVRFLREIPLARVEAMQRKGAEAYRTHFATSRDMTGEAFRIIRHNIDLAQQSQQQQQQQQQQPRILPMENGDD
jgi:hypothetical protein